MRVVEYATPPEKPVWPMKKLFLVLSVAVGACAGVALALFADLINARVDLLHLLKAQDEYPVYAIVQQDADFAAKLFSSAKG